jgi:predicted enzyme related to lactoylglutathione lyase
LSGIGLPIHPDFLVQDIERSTERVLRAGASPVRQAAYGRIAVFADPFGHGFCLIEFNSVVYDALLPAAEPEGS